MKRAVIIGGGIGGLATAAILARRGLEVDLFEARGQLGGRMGLLEHGGFRFDTGPSWYLMPEVYDHFFNLLGTTAEHELSLKRLTPAYRVFAQLANQPVTIVGDEIRDRETFEGLQAGAGHALGRYLDSAERTYRLALKHFLYTDFSSPRDFMSSTVLRNGPAMLRHSFQTMDKYVSGRFAHPVIKQILEYPAVFLGGSPYSTPALYHLMSYLDFRQGVFYPKNGMFSVTEAVARLAAGKGARLHTAQVVTRILTTGGRASGVELSDGQTVQADVVIAGGDLKHMQQLLPADRQDYTEHYWRKRQAGPSALLMYLGVKGKLPELSHHNLFFVKDWQQNFNAIYNGTDWPEQTSLYVSKPSQTDSRAAPAGHENLFVLVPLPARPEAQPDDIGAYADRYLKQIARQTGIADLTERIVYRKLFTPIDFETDFHSWQGSALGLSHTLRQSAFFRPGVRSRRYKGLYYVGANVRPGIGVPMCLISAELAAKHILANTTPGPMNPEQQ